MPHIRFHNLRKTYTTLLMKNEFNQKAITKALGHAKSIISIYTYTDTQAIIGDCSDAIQPFISEVHPYDWEDKEMLMKMFGEEIDWIKQEADNDVHDYSDIEEMYDIDNWYMEGSTEQRYHCSVLPIF